MEFNSQFLWTTKPTVRVHIAASHTLRKQHLKIIAIIEKIYLLRINKLFYTSNDSVSF